MNDELAAIRGRRVDMYGSGEHRTAQMLVDIDTLLKLCEEKDAETGQLRFSLKQANDWIADIEEREAACCPEDTGFDEYIKTLRAELDQLRRENEALNAIVSAYENGDAEALEEIENEQ
jgi:hypothetical protein